DPVNKLGVRLVYAELVVARLPRGSERRKEPEDLDSASRGELKESAYVTRVDRIGFPADAPGDPFGFISVVRLLRMNGRAGIDAPVAAVRRDLIERTAFAVAGGKDLGADVVAPPDRRRRQRRQHRGQQIGVVRLPGEVDRLGKRNELGPELLGCP